MSLQEILCLHMHAVVDASQLSMAARPPGIFIADPTQALSPLFKSDSQTQFNVTMFRARYVSQNHTKIFFSHALEYQIASSHVLAFTRLSPSLAQPSTKVFRHQIIKSSPSILLAFSRLVYSQSWLSRGTISRSSSVSAIAVLGRVVYV